LGTVVSALVRLSAVGATEVGVAATDVMALFDSSSHFFASSSSSIASSTLLFSMESLAFARFVSELFRAVIASFLISGVNAADSVMFLLVAETLISASSRNTDVYIYNNVLEGKCKYLIPSKRGRVGLFRAVFFEGCVVAWFQKNFFHYCVGFLHEV